MHQCYFAKAVDRNQTLKVHFEQSNTTCSKVSAGNGRTGYCQALSALSEQIGEGTAEMACLISKTHLLMNPPFSVFSEIEIADFYEIDHVSYPVRCITPSREQRRFSPHPILHHASPGHTTFDTDHTAYKTAASRCSDRYQT